MIAPSDNYTENERKVLDYCKIALSHLTTPRNGRNLYIARAGTILPELIRNIEQHKIPESKLQVYISRTEPVLTNRKLHDITHVYLGEKGLIEETQSRRMFGAKPWAQMSEKERLVDLASSG